MAGSPSPHKRRRVTRAGVAEAALPPGVADDTVLTLDVTTFERPEDEDADSDVEGGSQRAGSDEDDDESADDWSGDDESEASRGRSQGPASGSTTPTRKSSRSTSRALTPSRRTPSKRKTPSKPSARAAKATATAGPFVKLTASDAFFTAQSRPARTSANVFSDLLPPLTHQQYTSLLRSSTGAQQHEFAIEDLSFAHESRWPGWERELGQGFNLLCYGLGSKRDVLNRFATEVLAERADVVVVNGVFPRLTVRDVLATIEAAFPAVRQAPAPPPSAQASAVDVLAYRIYTHFLPPGLEPAPAHELAADDLYLVIHGIDSAGLRTAQAKTVLGLLASSPRIHLLASVDHVQAPILFSTAETHSRPHSYPTGWHDSVPASRGFNWLYHDLTTLQPYDAEVALRIASASRLPTAGGGAGLATEEGARHILTSVTELARRLFKALARSQMDSMAGLTFAKNGATTGGPAAVGSTTPGWAIETALFFHLCRERWISREETRFKALLLEFKDHRLVVESTVPPAGSADADDADEDDAAAAVAGSAPGTPRKKAKANARWLWIPLGREALGRLVDDLADVAD
jgi:origin recognition complex subunit 2